MPEEAKKARLVNARPWNCRAINRCGCLGSIYFWDLEDLRMPRGALTIHECYSCRATWTFFDELGAKAIAAWLRR